MHSVSTTSGFNNWYVFSFSPQGVCGLSIGGFTQTPNTARALVTLLERHFPDLSLTPASPVQCCVYKFYNYSSCALSSNTGYGIRDVNFS